MLCLKIVFYMSLYCGSAGKESTCNAEDLGSIPGLGRSPEAGKGYPLQYSGLENSMNCIVHGIAKSRTQLSDFHFTSYKRRSEECKVSLENCLFRRHSENSKDS